MNTTPTVLIEGEDGKPCRINVGDYNEKEHKLVSGEAKPKGAAKPKEETKPKAEEKPKFDRKAAMAKAKEAGVKVAGNIKNVELEKIIADIDAASAQVKTEKVFNVEAKDDKFIIVDGEGAQVGDEFATEDDANQMVSILKG